jgi:two-component system, chemotaxis family, protein-glutamate methylesterase/glutaminase
MVQDRWMATKIVVIGASAGGVEALMELVGRLPAHLDAAVFIVLHIPPYQQSQLAPILSRVSSLPVHDAEDGAPIRAGTIRVGVADMHLVLEPDCMRLTRGPREGRVRPSVDVLFRSAALAFGTGVVGAVLSGSLDDGTAGLWAIKDRGGLALVQHPDTAVHRAMPESAIEHVDVDHVVPLPAMADLLVDLIAQAQPPPPDAPATERLRIENVIAEAGNGLKAGVMDIGKVSKYTCPDCHGVLVQIEEGRIVRFRCHTGHGFSMQTLLIEVDRAIDDGLWDTVRAVEERIMLLKQAADIADAGGNAEAARRLRHKAGETERRLQPLREVALDPTFFGGNAAVRAVQDADA